MNADLRGPDPAIGNLQSPIENGITAKDAKRAKTGFRHCRLQTGNWKLAPAGRVTAYGLTVDGLRCAVYGQRLALMAGETPARRPGMTLCRVPAAVSRY